ncbi:MAG: hypothetical protein QM768_00590 [Agriterribacter sp.]
MRRRKFIGLVTFVTAGAGLAAYVFFENFEKFARKVIQKNTDGLKIDPKEIDKFFAAAAKENLWNINFPFHHRQILKWHYYIDNGIFTLPYIANYNTYKSKIVLTFLMSTDFFTNKMDESRAIKFTSIYDPYKIPCSNPFSNIFYPEEQAG